MKTLSILGLIVFLFACVDTKRNVEKNYSLQALSEQIGDEYTTIVYDLQSFEFPEGDTRSVEEIIDDRPTKKFIRELKEFELSKFDYYTFDLKKFYDDPSGENIQQCMMPTDKMNVIATRNGETTWRMVLTKVEKKWFAERLTPEYGEIIGWLRDSMQHAGTTKCKMFTIGSREFVTYQKNGISLYFNITGKPYTPWKFCEYLVEQYKSGQKFLKYKQEHPELFPPASFVADE